MAPSSKPIVVCGAGMAGVAAAYSLAVDYGRDDIVLVEAAAPLALTSDKSTEAYRNWWPGPDQAMTAFMNRSIDLLEGIAEASDNRINLKRRGCLFATGQAAAAERPAAVERAAEGMGRGPVGGHEGGG